MAPTDRPEPRLDRSADSQPAAGDPRARRFRQSARRPWFLRFSVVNTRKGVALILTIGILALLMVLAMSFAFASVHAQRTTSYSADLTNARLQAETGLQSVINMLKSELVDSDDYDNFFPGTKLFVNGTGDWSGFYFMISMVDVANGDTQVTEELLPAITHEVNGLTYIPNSVPTGKSIADTSVNTLLAANYSWIPVMKEQEYEGNFVDVVDGRYGYILIDETGKVDPNTAVDDTYTEGSEIGASFNHGYYLSEISLIDLGFTSTFSNKLRPYGSGGTGLQPQNAKWYSRYHIARILDIDGSSGQSELDTMNAMLFPYRRPDSISNQLATDSQNTPVTFNLRLEDNGGNIENDIGNNGDRILYMANYQGGIHPGIPYIRGWQERGDFDTDGDRFYSVSHRALNLMANIKDYIDTDRDASRDSDGVGVNAFPTYFGVENVPALSRLLVRAQNTSTVTLNASATYDIEHKLRVWFRPELMNQFGDLTSYASNARVIIYFQLKCATGSGTTYISAGAETVDITDFMNPALNVNSDASNVSNTAVTGSFASNGYMQWTGDGIYRDFAIATSTSISPVNTALRYAQFDDLTVRISRIVVLERDTNANGYSDEDVWDFCMINESRTGVAVYPDEQDALDIASAGPDSVYWTFDARAPLNNTFPGDWVFDGPFTTENGFTGKAMTAWWNDIKTTVFIRNGEMQSVSELGAILRMDPAKTTDTTAAYATFNLIDYYYNGTTHLRTEIEDGIRENYDSLDPAGPYWQDGEGNGGDRNILDYVRLNNENAAERELIGRININSRRTEVLQALFNRLAVTVPASNEVITSGKIDTLVDHIMARTFPQLVVNDSVPKLTGALPLSAINDDADSSYDPDDGNYWLSTPVRYRNPPLYGLLFQPDELTTFSEYELEFLLAHSMQMVNARHNYFTCVVAAQSIKDVGSIYGVDGSDQVVDGVLSRLSRWDDGSDKILAEQKIRVVLYRDARSNKITVERFDYLDE